VYITAKIASDVYYGCNADVIAARRSNAPTATAAVEYSANRKHRFGATVEEGVSAEGAVIAEGQGQNRQ